MVSVVSEAPDPDPASATWVVAESEREVLPEPRWRRWVWAAVTIGCVLGALALAWVALQRVPADASADIPLLDGTRLGFRGMGGASRWRCNDGHEHWSVPYWSGIVALGVAALGSWVRMPPARRRAR